MSATRCPSWCRADHHGEPPGRLRHWGPGEMVDADGVKVCVDLASVGDEQPKVVLTDSTAGPGWNVPLAGAEKLSKAIARRVRAGRRKGGA